jgi:hypothetical protein
MGSYESVIFTIRMAFLQIQHSFLSKTQNDNIHQLNSTNSWGALKWFDNFTGNGSNSYSTGNGSTKFTNMK